MNKNKQWLVIILAVAVADNASTGGQSPQSLYRAFLGNCTDQQWTAVLRVYGNGVREPPVATWRTAGNYIKKPWKAGIRA